LLHYLDLAWDELGIGNQADVVVAMDASIEKASTQIISLIGELENQAGKAPAELLQIAKGGLLDIQQNFENALKQRYSRPKIT